MAEKLQACLRHMHTPTPTLASKPSTLSCVGGPAGTSSMSGVVYITDESHKQLLDEAYCMFSWTNPLHADVFPSVSPTRVT
jgi:hypothetical protein